MPDTQSTAPPNLGRVELTQYLRPNGEPRQMHADVGEEHARRAEGMVLTCEVLARGDEPVILYARYEDEDPEEIPEDCESASNGPGPKTPMDALRIVIDRVYARRQGAQ